MTTAVIRPAREADLAALGALEKLGDARFALTGMDLVVDAPAPDPEDYQDALRDGGLLVAVDADDAPIGFVRVETLDGGPHLEQVSVHPDHAGHRLGAALVSAAERWAQSRGHRRMTLTTFTDVPWNGPYYARLGWTTLPESEWGPELTAARQHERDLGLDRWPRQAMVKHLA
jgi:GNAT superfamily N-acetyltransferase